MLNIITQHRRGSSDSWMNSTVIPRQGEIIIEERSDGSMKLKIGDGTHTFANLSYIDDKLAAEILSAHNRITQLVADRTVETNDVVTELRDIRVDPEGNTYTCAGDAVRAISRDVTDLRSSLTNFIDAEAIDGLLYDQYGEYGQALPYMLYLTANGEVLTDTGVQIISGGGGGGGSSSNSLKIQYVTTSPVVVSKDDKVELKFIFSGEDSSGDPILQASSTWSVGGRVVEYGKVFAGENTFDATKYLSVGTTKLLLTVVDDSGYKATKTWNVQVLDVRLTSSFNDKITYTANEPVILTYTPYGAIDKEIVFKLDGEEIDRVHSPASNSGDENKYELPAQEHGSHLVEVYIEAKVDQNKLESNHLVKDILWYSNDKSLSPVIGSNITEFTAKQYDVQNIEYTVYDPTTENPVVNIAVDETIVSTVTLDKPTNIYSYKTTQEGQHTIKFICRDTVKTVKANIEKLDIDISPVTTGLVFDFNPVGRTNDDNNRLWTYGEGDKKVSMTVSNNFDWVNGGYGTDENGNPYFCVKSGTTATIDYKMFADNAKVNGKEMKLIFKTVNVAKADCVFMSCLDNTTESDHVGIKMQPHEATIYGQNGKLDLAYSEEDIIEFEFNISKEVQSGNVNAIPMVMGYEDGVASRPMVYDGSFTFTQTDPKVITFGSPDCDVYIYRMKVYNTSLTDKEILSNFIADAMSAEEIINRYTRNQIYDENKQLTPDVLAEKCPHLRVYKVSAPHFTNNKSNKVTNTTIQQIYKGGDPVLDNWTCYNAQHSGQGTSSNNYGAAGRNLDFIMNKSGIDGVKPYFKLGDDSTASKITLTRTSVPTAYLNAKVNIASSNNLTNALLANEYNRLNPYKRSFVPREGIDNSWIKDTMEFYNCVIFIQETDPDMSTHREFADNDWHFYAIGNIGDSKKTDNSRLTDPDDKYECCVEIMDVELPLSDFPVNTVVNAMEYKEDATTGVKTYIWATQENLDKGILLEKQEDDSYVPSQDTVIDLTKTYYVDILENDDFSEDFTYGWRYLYEGDDEAENAEVFNFCKQKWIELYRFITTSSDEDFREHLKDYFVEDSALFYYLFTTRYCMVDNRAKNTFWHYGKTSDGTRKWDLCWDYDNDTSMGLNNYGKQVYRYGLEDIDTVDGQEVFRESDSTFFCRIRDLFADKLKDMYYTKDEAAGKEDNKYWLTAEQMITKCDDWQSEFPEELWRADIERKYIRTYNSSFISGKGDPQFLTNMCNGRMKYHRRQWERSQEKYMSSKYQTLKTSGDQNHANFRATAPDASSTTASVVPPRYEFTLTPYSHMYINVRYGSTSPKQVRVVNPGEPITIPYDGKADIINVDGAELITDFGNLSSFYFDTVSVQNAKRLKELHLGNDTTGYANEVLSSITTGSNTLLEVLDIENITGFDKSLDLKLLTNLRTIKAFGTKVPAVLFAEGGKITYAELPAINTIELKKLQYLTNDNFKLSSYDNVVDLTVEDCLNIDPLDLLDKCKNLSRVRLLDVDLGTKTYDYFESKLFNLRGIDAQGNTTDDAFITGNVHFKFITGAQYDSIKSRYDGLTITFDEIKCTIKYYDTDNELLLMEEAHGYHSMLPEVTEPIMAGRIQVMPERNPDPQYTYTFGGWKEINDGGLPEYIDFISDISKDLNLYPAFLPTIRTYTVTYVNDGGTILKTEEVEYGKLPVYSDIPQKESTGNPECYQFDTWIPAQNIPVTESRTCYATYSILLDTLYTITSEDISYSVDASNNLDITGYINNSKKLINIPSTITLSSGAIATVISISGFNDQNLEYVRLPDTLKTLKPRAFAQNARLSEITIPESVTTLGEGVFNNCRGLTKINYRATDAAFISSETSGPFINTQNSSGYSVFISKNVKTIPRKLFDTGNSGSSVYGARYVEFEEGSQCTWIKERAFAYAYTESINLPPLLEKIDSHAFLSSKLTEIELPDNVTTVANGCFDDNLLLRRFKISDSLTDMRGSSFKNCKDITFEIAGNTTFRVLPDGSLIKATRKQNGTVDYYTLIRGTSNTTAINTDYKISVIDDYAFNGIDLKQITLSSAVKNINQYAFSQCSNLTSVIFDNSNVNMIANFAFNNCGLTTLRIPNSVTSIGSFSFSNNTKLTEVIVDESSVPTDLGLKCFNSCSMLTKVELHREKVTMHNTDSDKYYNIFEGCTSLANIKVDWESAVDTSSSNQKGNRYNNDAPWGAGGYTVEVSGTKTHPRIIDVEVTYTDTTINYPKTV